MALTLAEKAQRQIDALRKTVDKLAPRHERAVAAITKKREAFAKRKVALELAEEKFAKLDSKRSEAERLISALEGAIGSGSAAVPSEPDVEALVASAEEATVQADSLLEDDIL
jgi:hypothetical protein